jgi:TRAP-type C4-dicarboxylate transport system permease small subunit
MIAAILGATLLSRQFYESSPLLGILLGILSAAIPVGIPIAIVIFRHNKSIGAPA